MVLPVNEFRGKNVRVVANYLAFFAQFVLFDKIMNGLWSKILRIVRKKSVLKNPSFLVHRCKLLTFHGSFQSCHKYSEFDNALTSNTFYNPNVLAQLNQKAEAKRFEDMSDKLSIYREVTSLSWLAQGFDCIAHELHG